MLGKPFCMFSWHFEAGNKIPLPICRSRAHNGDRTFHVSEFIGGIHRQQILRFLRLTSVQGFSTQLSVSPDIFPQLYDNMPVHCSCSCQRNRRQSVLAIRPASITESEKHDCSSLAQYESGSSPKISFCVPTTRSSTRALTVIVLVVEASPCSNGAVTQIGR